MSHEPTNNTNAAADELLSAYVDGELSTDELARVEERLANDAGARRLVAELRAISGALHDLPRERSPEGLVAAVAAQTSDATARHGDASGGAGDRLSLGGFTVGRSPRGWAWASLAVAAAVLVVVFTPEQIDDARPDVALSTPQPTPPATPAEEAAPPAPPAAGLRSESAGESAAADFEIADAPALAFDGDRAGADGALNGAASRTVGPLLGGAPGDDEDSTSAAPARANSPTAARGRRGGGGGGGRGGAAPLPGDQVTSELSPVGDGIPSAEAPIAPEPAYVVRVNIRPESYRRRTMDSLFASNSIALTALPEELGQAGEERLTEALELGGRAPAATRPVAADAPTSLDTLAGGRDEVEDLGAVEAEGVELFYVDAPLEQVLACLEDLRNDFSNYEAVEVEPTDAAKSPLLQQVQAANGGDESLSRFNRASALAPKEAVDRYVSEDELNRQVVLSQTNNSYFDPQSPAAQATQPATAGPEAQEGETAQRALDRAAGAGRGGRRGGTGIGGGGFGGGGLGGAGGASNEYFAGGAGGFAPQAFQNGQAVRLSNNAKAAPLRRELGEQAASPNRADTVNGTYGRSQVAAAQQAGEDRVQLLFMFKVGEEQAASAGAEPPSRPAAPAPPEQPPE